MEIKGAFPLYACIYVNQLFSSTFFVLHFLPIGQYLILFYVIIKGFGIVGD